MPDANELLAVIVVALDPQRFFAVLSATPSGRAFLRGETDEVVLTRAFLDEEAAVAQRALAALDQLRVLLPGAQAPDV